MTRTEKLSPALKVAELRKRDAAKVAENSRLKVLEYERKLEELHSTQMQISGYQKTAPCIKC